MLLAGERAVLCPAGGGSTMTNSPAVSSTESRNPASGSIDSLTSLQIVQLMNDQDAGVTVAVGRDAMSIARAVDVISDRIRSGGRLIYTGAGTSGRLGVLDASECPPTFSTPPEMVVGLIAGGHSALTRAIEGAEDLGDAGVADLKAVGLTAKDVVVGIATSGRTPYVIEGLRYAQSLGAYAIGFACNSGSELIAVSDLMITPIVGAEVITGSTRLKAGTATKMVLNMLTTGTMVRLGKTYGNLMVDLRATNVKLRDRSIRIVAELASVPRVAAEELLVRCDGEVKTAIVMHSHKISPSDARTRLEKVGGHLRAALADSALDRFAEQPQ